MKKKIKIPTFNLLSKEDRKELLRLFPDEFEKAVNWDVIDKMTDKERLLKVFPNEFMSAIDWSVVDKITDKEK